jgi:transcriptional regulator with XRE-family HTH domain
LTALSNIVEDSSIMSEQASASVDQRIARRVRELRAGLGLSLEALATRSGVSRSMISVIERGESSATAVVLEKLATGLGVALASLFDEPAAQTGPVARLAEQPLWRDPASGYVRRNVSPSGPASPFQIVEVEFPAGARVAFESGTREHGLQQQVWVLDGRIDVTVGRQTHRLDVGDCLAHALDGPTAFANPTRKAARYAVVLTTPFHHRS